MDVWRDVRPDPVHAETLAPYATRDFGDFNLFHLNGDEVDPALARVGGLPPGARNAVCPMWELPSYPREWASQLERFDEVWAASLFIADAIRPAVSIPVLHLPLATQVTPLWLRSRRYFAIPEAAYAFLFFYDLRSFIERKNPAAVMAAFRGYLAGRPDADACLVVKVHGSANAPDARAHLADLVADLDARVLLIDRQMEEDEVHALIYNCDAFVSLHRAEGYGLGLAEAMALGKPVIGTAYSGNLDFMTSDVAHLVPFEPVAVSEGAYPHWQGQTWAEPDIDEAIRTMTELYDSPDSGRALGQRAGRHMQAHFSYRAAGLRYLDRLEMSDRATGAAVQWPQGAR
jgi:glycosyltransferase involved in cell wall biosynthesis